MFKVIKQRLIFICKLVGRTFEDKQTENLSTIMKFVKIKSKQVFFLSARPYGNFI